MPLLQPCPHWGVQIDLYCDTGISNHLGGMVELSIIGTLFINWFN